MRQPEHGGSPPRPVGSVSEPLDSWKEIAAYLKRGVRTVRRWEKQEGLPVRRHAHGKSGTIYAYKEEIDAWRKTRGLERRAAPPTPAPASRRAMLAVLPFHNLSRDQEQEYLADGFTQDLITELARLEPPRLGVIARTSIMQLKQQQLNVSQCAQLLGVDYLVEGSIRREGDKLRVTAQLIQASDQTHLWAERFDRPFDDVLRLQSDIAHRVAREIGARLSGQGERAQATPVDPAAYRACLKGRYFMYRLTPEDIRRSLTLFHEALRFDPQCAAAYAGVAEAHVWLAMFGGVPPRQAFPQALDACERGLSLDQNLAEAFAAHGAYQTYYGWQWADAERSLRRALELNPANAPVRETYGELLSMLGRHTEAIEEGRQACDTDPLSLFVNSGMGFILGLARQHDAAIEKLRQTLELDPEYPSTHLNLGLAYLGKGQTDAAIAALTEAHRRLPYLPDVAALLAYAHAVAGRKRKAAAMLDELRMRSRQEYVPRFLLAVVSVGLGQNVLALAELEATYAERPWMMGMLKTLPLLDPLRDDARFEQLLRRMNLH